MVEARGGAARRTTPKRNTASAPSSGRSWRRTAAAPTWPPTIRARACRRSDEPPAPRKAKRKARKPDAPEPVAPPPPPAAASDITGKLRVELADQAIAYLEKALALRPHYADAMTYLGLSGGRSRSRCSPSRPPGSRRSIARTSGRSARWRRAPGRADDGVRGFPRRRRRRRRAPAASGSGTRLSSRFHGALIAVGVAYSFWHVEELSPPLLKLTFLSAAPPPPPPPPPPGGGGAAAKKKVAVKPKTGRGAEADEIVQPQGDAQESRAAQGRAQAGGQGRKGRRQGRHHRRHARRHHRRQPGGTIGGDARRHDRRHGAGPPSAKFLPPHMGAAQKLSGADPPFPPSLRKTGVVYRVLVKICVTTTGTVDKVTMLKGADPLLDDGVVVDGEDLALPAAHGERRRRPVLLPGDVRVQAPVETRPKPRRQTDTWISRLSDCGTRWGSSPAASSLVLVAMSLYSLAITGERLLHLLARPQAVAPLHRGAGADGRGRRGGCARRSGSTSASPAARWPASSAPG